MNNSSPQIDGFLRAKDIQALCRIGKTTFYQWIKDGKLSEGFKLGERIRAWRCSEVEALMNFLSAGGDSLADK